MLCLQLALPIIFPALEPEKIAIPCNHSLGKEAGKQVKTSLSNFVRKWQVGGAKKKTSNAIVPVVVPVCRQFSESTLNRKRNKAATNLS